MNLKFIREYLQPKESLGCDIGAKSVKFARLSKKQKGILSLEAIGMLECESLSENLAEAEKVRRFFKEHGVYGLHANINIECASLKIRRMDIADMPAADTKIAISWNFREHVDGPIEKYKVSHTDMAAIKKDSAGRKPIMAFAAAEKDIEEMAKLAKHLGIKTSSIEPNATALLASFDYSVGWEPGKNYVMLDLSTDTSNFIAMRDGDLLFSRPLVGLGGKGLTKSLAKVSGVAPVQAGDKIESYLDSEKKALSVDSADSVRSVVDDFMGRMVVEVQRSIDAFCMMYHVDNVDRIYLVGGLSLLPNVTSYLSKNLGIETLLFNPFNKIDLEPIGGGITNPQLYALAVGLAIPRM